MSKGDKPSIATKLPSKPIPINLIDIGNRFRGNLGSLDGLKESIKEVGLINALSVLDKMAYRNSGNKLAEGHEEDPSKPFLLLAGERRLLAIAQLIEEGEWNASTVDCRVFPTMLSADELRVIELVENIERKPMEHQERDELIAEIHAIRVGQKGVTLPGPSAKGKAGHKLSDTAALLGMSPGTVSRALKRYEAMKSMPEVAAAKSAREADKIIQRHMRQLAIEEKNRRLKARRGGIDKIKKDLIDSYVVGDAIEGLKGLEDETIDFFEIDPPYGTDYPELAKDRSSVMEYSETKDFKALVNQFMPEVARSLKDGRWGILWFACQNYQIALDAILSVGLQVNPTAFLWQKPNGSTRNPQYIMPSAYEQAFYFRKGNAELRKVPGQNYFFYPRVPERWRIHPTERPIAMLVDIMECFVAPGSVIVSPFLGSGATILAAHNFGCRCFGWDRQESYKERHEHRVLSQPGPNFIADIEVANKVAPSS